MDCCLFLGAALGTGTRRDKSGTQVNLKDLTFYNPQQEKMENNLTGGGVSDLTSNSSSDSISDSISDGSATVGATFTREQEQDVIKSVEPEQESVHDLTLEDKAPNLVPTPLSIAERIHDFGQKLDFAISFLEK